jgi:hypothetical protein
MDPANPGMVIGGHRAADGQDNPPMNEEPVHHVSLLRQLPPSLRFLCLFYVFSAACAVGTGCVLVWKGGVPYSVWLLFGITTAITMLLAVGILQRSAFLRWFAVVIAAMTVLYRLYWLARSGPLGLSEWATLCISLAVAGTTIYCLNTRAAEKWYRSARG